MRGDHAQGAVAHVVELVVVGHIASTNQLDAGLVHAALQKLLHHRSTRARRHKHKQRIGLEVADLLQEGGEIGVAHGHPQRLGHLTAVEQQPLREEFFSVQARTVIADQGHHFLDAVFRSPVGQCHRSLRQGEAGAHDVRRGQGDAAGGCGHDHLGCFGLGGNGGCSQGRWRDAKTSQHIDLVIDHQFLRQAFGDIRDAGVVFDDQLDLAAGHGVAVLRHVEASSRFNLATGGGLLPGHGQDQADFELSLLGAGVAGQQGACSQCCGAEELSFLHRESPGWVISEYGNEGQSAVD